MNSQIKTYLVMFSILLVYVGAACDPEESALVIETSQRGEASAVADKPDSLKSRNFYEIKGLDMAHYQVTSEKARELVGGNTIPWRSGQYTIPRGDTLPRVLFKNHSERSVQDRLMSMSRFMLGENIEETDIVDNVQMLSLQTDLGFSYCAKGTGGFVSKLYMPKRGVSQLKDTKEAVSLALEQVAESGLLTLHEDETIDVVAVSSTWQAGWEERDGEIVPIYYEMGEGQEPVTQFKSEYTVVFGRRYKGIPIIGPTLRVRLDPKGRMIAFVNPWRNIKGEGDPPIELLNPEQVEEMENQGLGQELELINSICGYFEAPGVGYLQETPGVGCSYTYYNPEAAGTAASELVEQLSIAVDETLLLKGEKMEFEIPPEPPSNAEDIPE